MIDHDHGLLETRTAPLRLDGSAVAARVIEAWYICLLDGVDALRRHRSAEVVLLNNTRVRCPWLKLAR